MFLVVIRWLFLRPIADTQGSNDPEDYPLRPMDSCGCIMSMEAAALQQIIASSSSVLLVAVLLAAGRQRTPPISDDSENCIRASLKQDLDLVRRHILSRLVRLFTSPLRACTGPMPKSCIH
jgi:hypothetical protein